MPMGIHNPLPSSMACEYFSASKHCEGQELITPLFCSGVQEMWEDLDLLR
jgi:hypothetical protein